MRPLRVVACVALIAAFASVTVPWTVSSHRPSGEQALGALDFTPIGRSDSSRMATTTTPLLDPASGADGTLEPDGVLLEPALRSVVELARPDGGAPVARPRVVDLNVWRLDNNISWYGPGFYGHNGACGMFGSNGLDKEDIGVAHRTLPCGTRVTFRYNGRTVVTRVVDRGPYVAGRIWDMTRGLCEALGHCFTGGGVWYKIG